MRTALTYLLAWTARIVFCLVAGRMIVWLMFPLAYESHYGGLYLTLLAAILVCITRVRP